MEEILKIDKIEKYYGNKSNLTKALDNISFSVEKGEFVAIMGASGSGKTTLLNSISTIDRVTSGHIYVSGEDITKLRGNELNRFRREELGFIFQDFNLLDTLTGYENIALALSIQNVPTKQIDERIKKVAKELDIVNILEKYPSMELVPIDKEQFKGLSDGFGYPQTARLFPHRIQGEGHFLALFHKKEDENGSGSGAAVLRLSGDEKEASKRAKEAGKQEDLMKFLKNCRKEWDLGRIYIRDEQVYYLPEGLKTGLPLRFLRTGLHLGELKKGRFEPSQAFAMALKKDEYPVRLDLKTEDERVIRYLKGETISLVNEEEPVKGWCLVTVEGFPLGWAKGNGMTLKNKYYAGWRWQ